jgi:hypothetical protein
MIGKLVKVKFLEAEESDVDFFSVGDTGVVVLKSGTDWQVDFDYDERCSYDSGTEQDNKCWFVGDNQLEEV